MNAVEDIRSIPAFGGEAVIYAGGREDGDAMQAAEEAILAVHRTLTRFDPWSELCRLNADPRATVPVSPLMFRFVEAVRRAGESSDGLVDATCLPAVERSGYTRSLSAPAGEEVAPPPVQAVAAAPAAVIEDASGDWRDLHLDFDSRTVTRPPGLRLDAGGLGKGLAADLAAEPLAEFGTFAVECLGEFRFGGTSGAPRLIQVAAPHPDDGPIAELRSPEGAIATSGVSKRSWTGADGRPAHHLIDPHTGEPAQSGLIQVTASAPTALEAEIRAKAALLAGPSAAAAWLPDGGVIVADDRETMIVPPFTLPETGS